MDTKVVELGVAAVVVLLILREILPWVRSMAGKASKAACQAETVLATHERTEAGFFREMVQALQRVEENQRRTADVLGALLDESHRNQTEVRARDTALLEKLTRLETRIDT